MTSQQDEIALRSGFEDLLGPAMTATLWSMLKDRDDLATRDDVSSARDELKGEIALVRGEMAEIRAELNSFVRTFIGVQAATIAAATGIVYALVRLT